MKRARFFYLLRLARAMRRFNYSEIERWTRLYWAGQGFATGYEANK